MDDCNWIRIGDYDWMEVDERFVRRIAGMGLITLIIMSCDMYFLSILAIGHVYQLAMSPLESKQGTVFSLKMNNPLSMEMGRWENEAEGERSGGEQAREGGGGEQVWEFFQSPPLLSPWAPKGSENRKIVQKLSETGLERSSRALDKSGCVKIALRIQWNASRSPKTNKKSENPSVRSVLGPGSITILGPYPIYSIL